jgi:vacuolar-type H+-ATPase subunit E/Vma4
MMPTSKQPSMVTALAPVIDALLRAAQADAANSMSAAEADAAAQLAQARAEAAAIVARAKADGEAAAEHASAAALIAARRESRETILAAHRRAYELLRQGVFDELARRADSPAGSALLAQLEALVRARLGPDATIGRLDAPRIGVRATDGKRQVEMTVDPFVERELAAFGDRIEALWR